jgi:hypothetical protein
MLKLASIVKILELVAPFAGVDTAKLNAVLEILKIIAAETADADGKG